MNNFLEKKMKSLGRLLSELATPLPTNKDDPEFMDDPISDSDVEHSDQGLQNHHYLEVENGKIKKQLDLQMDLDQKVYNGKKVSRKEYQDEEFDSSAFEEESIDSFDSLNSDKDDVESNQDDNEFNASSDSNSESESYSDSESIMSTQSQNQKEKDEIHQELQKIKQEEKNLLSTLSKGSKQDVIKGKNIQNQKTLWDGLLNLRIRMQKLVSNANQLPSHDTYSTLFVNDQEKEMAKDVFKGLGMVLSDLINIRMDWIHDIPELQDPSSDPADQDPLKVKNVKKRSLDETEIENMDTNQLWKSIQELDSHFLSYPFTSFDSLYPL